MTTRVERIEATLQGAFQPTTLTVLDESHGHNVPRGSESHVRVVVVADAFEGKSAVERHRLVYAALGDELRSGLHALAVTAKTPGEWAAAPEVPVSPPCHGGSKR